MSPTQPKRSAGSAAAATVTAAELDASVSASTAASTTSSPLLPPPPPAKRARKDSTDVDVDGSDTTSAVSAAASSASPSDGSSGDAGSSSDGESPSSPLGALPGNLTFQAKRMENGGQMMMIAPARGGGVAGADEEKCFSNPQDMFDDMAKKLRRRFPKALDAFLKKSSARRFRVATMCSGTEAPLVAMRMLSAALDGADFFEHVFSCEIEPFKQAFIQRNFQPALLFRDITELGNDEAVTAHGGLAAVPGADIVVAGTVCKDFSTKNKFRKEMDDLGESGQTFYGLKRYVARHFPSVVIVENVRTAPWEMMAETFLNLRSDAHPGKRYRVTVLKSSSRCFYVPQSRERGYLCAMLEGGGDQARYRDVLRNMAHSAGPCMMDYLLPDSDPAVRAILLNPRGRARVDNEGEAHVSWNRCEYRHSREREKLGLQRPYTRWDDTGNVDPPYWAMGEWLRTCSFRVKDAIDILFLKGAADPATARDDRYTSILYDVGQNVDRQQSGMTGISKCVTPTWIPFLPSRGRPLCGVECLGLQAIPSRGLNVSYESERALYDLAGNAMTTSIVGACMVSALLSGVEPTGSPPTGGVTGGESEVFDLTVRRRRRAITPDKLVSLARSVANKAPLCHCGEDSGTMQSRRRFRCVDCLLAVCEACAARSRNPPHKFELCSSSDASDTATQEEEGVEGDESTPAKPASPPPSPGIRHVGKTFGISRVPTCVSFDMASVLPALRGDAQKQKHAARVGALLRRRTLRLVNRYQSLDEWLAVYEHEKKDVYAHLAFVAETFEWRVFVPELWSASHAHKGKPTVVVTREGGWLLADPGARTAKLRITGTNLGDAWQTSLGVVYGVGDKKPPRQPQTLRVEALDGEPEVGELVGGEYTHLKACGGARDMLYKQVEGSASPLAGGGAVPAPTLTQVSQSLLPEVASQEKQEVGGGGGGGGRSLFFFADVNELGKTEEDYYSFARCCGRRFLDAREHRDPLMVTQKGWSLSDRPETVKCLHVAYTVAAGTLHIDEGVSEYVPVCNLRLRYLDGCSSAFVVQRFKLPAHIHTSSVFSNTDDVFANLRCQEYDWQRISMDMVLRPRVCSFCSPSRPPVRYSKVTRRYAADPVAMRAYEVALHTRQSALLVRAKVSGGAEAAAGDDVNNREVDVRLVINPVALAHRAVARFGDRMPLELQCSWSLRRSAYEGPAAPLRLRGCASEAPAAQPAGFAGTLRDEQLRSLAWMLRRETVASDEALWLNMEVEEEVLRSDPDLVLAAVAEAPTVRRGGVLADDVGFGKTVLTLAMVAADAPAADADVDVDGPQAAAAAHVLEEASTLPGTRATLVVSPPHLVTQWHEEARRFVPTCRVCLVEDFARFNGRDGAAAAAVAAAAAEEADLVIVSTTALLARVGRSERILGNGARWFLDELQAVQENKPKAFWLEGLRWRRVVVDEFTYMSPESILMVKGIEADARWLLSATPDFSSVGKVAQMSELLHVRLGGIPHLDDVDAAAAQAAALDGGGGGRGGSMFLRRLLHSRAERFLDTFVRQNVSSLDVVPMTLRNERFTMGKLHRRLYFKRCEKEPDDASLLRLAAGLSVSGDEVGNLQKRKDADVLELGAKAAVAYKLRRKEMRPGTILDGWADSATRMDPEVAVTLRRIIRAAKAEAEKALPGGEGSRRRSTKEEPTLIEATHTIRAVARVLVERVRTLRYLKHARGCVVCEEGEKDKEAGEAPAAVGDGRLCVSVACGHVGHRTHFEGAILTTMTCPVEGCAAPVRENTVRPVVMDDEPEASPKAKLEAALALVGRLRAENVSEKVIVFGQDLRLLSEFHDMLRTDDDNVLCKLYGEYTSAKAGRELQKFYDYGRVLLVLLGEGASGLNLTHARNVVFLHPVHGTKQEVQACERQAIGRVLRYGQSKEVRVFRFVTNETIDEDLLMYARAEGSSSDGQQQAAAAAASN